MSNSSQVNGQTRATVVYLREAGVQVKLATALLGARDSWHLEHARAIVELAIKKLELCDRQLVRVMVARQRAVNKAS